MNVWHFCLINDHMTVCDTDLHQRKGQLPTSEGSLPNLKPSGTKWYHILILLPGYGQYEATGAGTCQGGGKAGS